MDEEAPVAIQPKTLYVPKPEIQVILMYSLFISHLLRDDGESSRTLESLLVSAALIQGTREEASHRGVQYLHCTHPVSLPAAAHPGNIANFVQHVFILSTVE